MRTGKPDETSTPPVLQPTTFDCEPLLDIEPLALGFTYWFEAESNGEPYSIAIRFTGHRVGTKGKRARNETFDIIETVENVVPGCGRVALTVRVRGIATGQWKIVAAPNSETRGRSDLARLPPARRRKLPSGSTSGTTTFAPVVEVLAPAARFGAWPSLVGFGVVVALSTQAVVATHVGLNVTGVLTLSAVASIIGLLGAKSYYLIGHALARRFLPGHANDRPPPLLSAGMCIQGFVAASLLTLIVGGVLADLPVGVLLDTTAPALFFGMAIGRFGCFFGGCCAGRPTASRVGIWSSDRRIGVCRIPTQLLESALALCLGLATFLVMWTTTPKPTGLFFVAGVAAYTLGRQILLPLRDNPRKTTFGRRISTSLAATACVMAVVAVVA